MTERNRQNLFTKDEVAVYSIGGKKRVVNIEETMTGPDSLPWARVTGDLVDRSFCTPIYHLTKVEI